MVAYYSTVAYWLHIINQDLHTPSQSYNWHYSFIWELVAYIIASIQTNIIQDRHSVAQLTLIQSFELHIFWTLLTLKFTNIIVQMNFKIQESNWYFNQCIFIQLLCSWYLMTIIKIVKCSTCLFNHFILRVIWATFPN